MTRDDALLAASFAAAALAAGWALLRQARPARAGRGAERGAAPPPAPATPPPAGPAGVAPALLALLAAVDARWPGRSRASDGTLPSAAHRAANPNSDHDLGLAVDITHDPDRGPDLADLAEVLRADPRITYVILRDRIANKAIGSNAWRAYETRGIPHDPHDSHLHASLGAGARDDRGAWDLSSVRRSSEVSA